MASFQAERIIVLFRHRGAAASLEARIAALMQSHAITHLLRMIADMALHAGRPLTDVTLARCRAVIGSPSSRASRGDRAQPGGKRSIASISYCTNIRTPPH